MDKISLKKNITGLNYKIFPTTFKTIFLCVNLVQEFLVYIITMPLSPLLHLLCVSLIPDRFMIFS